jgi:hypothetical protein
LYDALQSAEPISLELDRNLQVLLPSQAAKQVDLPPAFFNMTADELKREQQMRFVNMFCCYAQLPASDTKIYDVLLKYPLKIHLSNVALPISSRFHTEAVYSLPQTVGLEKCFKSQFVEYEYCEL